MKVFILVLSLFFMQSCSIFDSSYQDPTEITDPETISAEYRSVRESVLLSGYLSPVHFSLSVEIDSSHAELDLSDLEISLSSGEVVLYVPCVDSQLQSYYSKKIYFFRSDFDTINAHTPLVLTLVHPAIGAYQTTFLMPINQKIQSVIPSFIDPYFPVDSLQINCAPITNETLSVDVSYYNRFDNKYYRYALNKENAIPFEASAYASPTDVDSIVITGRSVRSITPDGFATNSRISVRSVKTPRLAIFRKQ